MSRESAPAVVAGTHRVTWLALAVLMSSTALAAQSPRNLSRDSSVIAAGEWDDDWWYPEGRIVLFGQRFSLVTGVAATRFVRRGTREAFGALRIDPNLDLYRPRAAAGFAPDVDLLWVGLASAGRKARYFAPTAGVRYTPIAATRNHWLAPHLSLRAGPYFARTSTSGSATVLGANLALGLNVARVLAMRTRLDLVRDVRGHDLSTFRVDLAFRVPPTAPRRARPKMHDFVSPPGRLVDVGGHRLHLVCLGEGSPTIVLEAGMSDAWVVWDRLLPELARTTRACTYDRAGIGYSDPGPLPRTGRRLASELHTLLGAAGERPPFVLVGHSFGGLIARLYAAEYLEEVEGMVLVDATHEDFQSRYPAVMREQWARAMETFRTLAERGEQGQRLPPVVPNLPHAVASRPSWYRTLYEEGRAAQASADEVRSARRVLDIPLVVVTAGRPEGVRGSRRATAEVRALWTELQADLVRLSPRGVQVVAAKSGHYVQRSEPRVVLDAVHRVVEVVRLRR